MTFISVISAQNVEVEVCVNCSSRCIFTFIFADFSVFIFRSPSRRALLRAIYNVEKNFLVVGILEEFELTLKVLERMLPRYFSGAEKLYRTPGKTLSRLNMILSLERKKTDSKSRSVVKLIKTFKNIKKT